MITSRRTRAPLAVTALLAVSALATSCTGATPAQEVAVSDYGSGLWPDRPRVRLSFDVAPDLASATGKESVAFTPDAPTCDLDFRAWPNNPTMHEAGDALTVTSASVEGRPATPQVTAAGAPDGAPGTLITVPLRDCLAAGQTTHAELDFRLILGADANERVGHSPETRTAWFGSGFPLLSWIRGSGWARDPAVPMNGETAASEDFMLSDLSVTAPSDDKVLGPGTSAGDAPGPTPGTTTHRFAASAIRDVTVALGQYDVLDRDIGAVHLHLATTTSGTKATPTQWADQIERAVTGLTQLFGPFPYPDLTVAITPGQSDGTEYPTALQMTDSTNDDLPALIAHEVSHQWFYSLVGNNQAKDPWLDESLATVGEAIVGGDAGSYQYDDTPHSVAGLMGRPMSYWAAHGGFKRYNQGVYDQGAAVLLEARRRVGDQAFDADLRKYILANAHHVATPVSFAQAFGDQPPVLDLLRDAGALPTSP
ncbi:M1 family aminopeptidase [Pseudonocardia adelaidensis]|uniref:Peptidase M1 membrane alanine aminopeptidase domain-containing protein n=1 Tax=Pseudonocardia adelaidensis TaxID=648754 RepID=A0ABP9PB47_9PSEU